MTINLPERQDFWMVDYSSKSILAHHISNISVYPIPSELKYLSPTCRPPVLASAKHEDHFQSISKHDSSSCQNCWLCGTNKVFARTKERQKFWYCVSCSFMLKTWRDQPLIDPIELAQYWSELSFHSLWLLSPFAALSSCPYLWQACAAIPPSLLCIHTCNAQRLDLITTLPSLQQWNDNRKGWGTSEDS